MKKISMIIGLAILLTGPAKINAQGLYITAGGGYGLKLGSMAISANYSSTNVESVSASFGKGILPNLGVGYALNEHLAAEVNFNYLMGSKVKFTDASNPNTPADEEILKGRMLRIIPALRLTSGEKLKPYARIGMIIGVMNRLIDESTNYSSIWPSGYDTYHEVSTFQGGVSLGFSGAIGITYPLSDKLAIYCEAGAMSQAWAPKKRILTTYEVNGVDKLSTLDKRDVETEFVDSYNPSVSTPTTQPGKSLKIYLPYSSWGFNVGLHISLGKKKE